MSPIVKELRQAAKCAPLWKTIFEAAADKIERLQEDNNKIRGRMHDQWINQNKVKADAVRMEIENLHNSYPHLDGPHLGILTHRANKIERGEV